MAELYSSERNIKIIRKLRELLRDLPVFCSEFAVGVENTTTPLTRLNYIIDVKIFLHYLIDEKVLPFNSVKDISLDALDKLPVSVFESFLSYVTAYGDDDNIRTNTEYGKARKLSALRALFKFFYKREKLSRNAVALIDTPKIHTKNIIRLDIKEIEQILETAQNGEGLTSRQKSYHELTKVRDLAILTLFLGSGIRISELVGIDVQDIDIENREFVITRKGGNQDILPFGDEVMEALEAYLEIRRGIIPAEGHEEAFFLSMQRKRINVRTVENLVKKYAAIAAPLKKISPHKLRSTYGTMLYNKTGDIYIVADMLGHKDVNTTRKHYAEIEKDRKRYAAEVIKLKNTDPTADNED